MHCTDWLLLLWYSNTRADGHGGMAVAHFPLTFFFQFYPVNAAAAAAAAQQQQKTRKCFAARLI